MIRLYLILLVILCLTHVNATWKVDQRCATQPAARRRQLEGDESAPDDEAYWEHKPQQYKQEDSLSLKRNLRGSTETPRRQLEHGLVEAFRLKMYWQEGYCVSADTDNHWRHSLSSFTHTLYYCVVAGGMDRTKVVHELSRRNV